MASVASQDFDARAAGLRSWIRSHDAQVRAAVELLIWHEHWLRRSDFGKACMFRHPNGVITISWDKAAQFVEGCIASTSQLVILNIAIGLAQDRPRLSELGHAHARAVATAYMAALGLPELAPAVPRG